MLLLLANNEEGMERFDESGAKRLSNDQNEKRWGNVQFGLRAIKEGPSNIK
jgi:hypothetical protein